MIFSLELPLKFSANFHRQNLYLNSSMKRVKPFCLSRLTVNLFMVFSRSTSPHWLLSVIENTQQKIIDKTAGSY